MIHPYYKTPYILRIRRSGELATVVFYLIAGALTSGTDYTLFFVSFTVFPLGLLAATVIAYIGGLLVSFALSRFWVFKKNAKGEGFGTSVWRYGTLLGINLVITYLMLLAMQTWFGLSPLIGKFVVWFFMTFWNYYMNKYWVFKGPRQVRNRFYFAHKIIRAPKRTAKK